MRVPAHWLLVATVLATGFGCGDEETPRSGSNTNSLPAVDSPEPAIQDPRFRVEWYWSALLNEPPPSAARPTPSGEASIDELIERIVSTPPEDSRALLTEVGQVGARARSALCRALEASLDADPPDPENRYRLLTALARVNGPDAAPVLCRLLRDELVETSALAAELLGTAEAPWVLPRLLKTFGKWDNNRSILTRVMAIEAATRYRVYSGIPHLLALLAENTALEVPDTERNWERTTRMAWFKDEIERVLIKVSGEDFGFDAGQGEAAMRESVGRWLAWWDAHEEEFLSGERTSESTADPALREQIDRLLSVGFTAYQLRNVDNARWLLEHLGPLAVPQLIGALDHAELFIRVHAAEVLGRIGDRRARDPFVRRLGIEKEPPARAQVAAALGAVGTASEVPLLTKMAEDDSETLTVRVAALHSLGAIGDLSSDAPIARAASRRPVDELTIAAWIVQAQHGDESAFESLLAELASDRLNDRARGSTALSEAFHVDFDMDPYAEAEARKKSIDAWREWWRQR